MNEPPQPTKEIVTISEMARMVGLSRARFYQLIKESIFPEPSRNPQTKRPFYDRQQQEQCLLVRKTSCGVNGKAILFYGIRPGQQGPMKIRKRREVKHKPAPTTRKDSVAETGNPLIKELLSGLGQLGMAEVTEARVRNVLAAEYPDGYQGMDQAELLMSVFRHLKRRDSQDNVAR